MMNDKYNNNKKIILKKKIIIIIIKQLVSIERLIYMCIHIETE